VPVEVLLDLGGVLELVEVLLLEATVVVLDATVVLEAAPAAGATVEATVVEPDVEVALDTGAALGGVLAATLVCVAAASSGVSVAEVRSITPMLGVTRLGIGSAADALPELLEPSPAPQAARPNVRTLHNTIFFIDHYPG
jgi:hypothetical protein